MAYLFLYALYSDTISVSVKEFYAVYVMLNIDFNMFVVIWLHFFWGGGGGGYDQTNIFFTNRNVHDKIYLHSKNGYVYYINI